MRISDWSSDVCSSDLAPHKATDPLQVAARLATDTSAIVGRHIDPMEAALINVGSLQAGTTHNIIPATASLSGTIRALSTEVHDALQARLQDRKSTRLNSSH